MAEVHSKTDNEAVASERQRAELLLGVSRNVEFKATVDVTSLGVLSIAVLVSSILLSTAVVVGTALTGSRHGGWSG